MLHTTAAYLPADLQEDEIKGFQDLVTAVKHLYPGKGGALVSALLDLPDVKEEFTTMSTAEDAQLFMWKLHNMISAETFPSRSPFPASLGIGVDSFKRGATARLHLGDLGRAEKDEVLQATSARWRMRDGLVVDPLDRRDARDLPPDRTMLGRAFWTFIHASSVYLDQQPDARALASFRSIFDSIYHVFPCPVCKSHFRSFYHDEQLQAELSHLRSKHDAILFAWKIHNVVTAWGIRRADWSRAIFPREFGLNASLFLLPISSSSSSPQMRIDRVCDNLQPDCMTRPMRLALIADVQARWQIEGGIDQPLEDKPPAACDPPRKGEPVLQLDMYVMGKCPWCGKALQELEEKLNCKFTCQQDGRTVEGQLDFRLHMVGLNDGSYEEPNLKAIHGASELAGEKLELCARQHYARDYQYVKFISCMDRNVSQIPLLASQCASEAAMDIDLLVSCANGNGEQLVAASYGYSSWMGITTTPSFVLNRRKKVAGMPSNFSSMLCEELSSPVELQAPRLMELHDKDEETSRSSARRVRMGPLQTEGARQTKGGKRTVARNVDVLREPSYDVGSGDLEGIEEEADKSKVLFQAAVWSLIALAFCVLMLSPFVILLWMRRRLGKGERRSLLRQASR